jgi:hypothetical protein
MAVIDLITVDTRQGVIIVSGNGIYGAEKEVANVLSAFKNVS